MVFVLASGSKHKQKEFLQMLPSGWTLQTPLEAGVQDFSPIEDGVTFSENALIKATALYQALDHKKPVLADDSGLCVEALGGQPGVYSARYGEDVYRRPLTDQEKNQLLLQRLKGAKNRKAHYVCSLVLLWEPDRFWIFQETWHGQIHQEPLGSGGFGYDPLFWLPDLGRTAGQLTDEEKHDRSHRGRALAQLKRSLGL